MFNRRHSRLGGGEGGGHGDDLLITPLLDLFVSLVPFLIMSVVLTKINTIDVGIAKPVAAKASADANAFDLTLKVTDTKAEVLLQGRVTQTITRTNDGTWIEAVRKSLVDIKRTHPDEIKIRMEPKGKVNLAVLMQLMDAARKLKDADGEITRKDEQGRLIKLQYLFPNVILRGVYSS